MIAGPDGVSRSTSSGDNWLIIDGVPYQVLRAADNVAAAQTDDPFITGVANYKIRIVSLFAMADDTATDLTINTVDSGADTALVPVLYFGANGGVVLPLNPVGWYESANAGEGISLTTGAGDNVSAIAFYILVPA